MLDSVFEPAELVTAPEEILGPVTDPDARETLRTLGLPVWENPWFDVDGMIGERLEPVSEWDGQLVNSSLRSFVHFHYLLKAEAPFYDPESRGRAERETTRRRLRETMASLDPAALEHPASCWSDILTSIVDLTHRY